MKLILIDGNSIMYRAYYATSTSRTMLQNSKGVYTNAIYAFANMINKIIDQEYDAILVAFDKGKHTFRHEIDPNYKAGRKPMPDEMRSQIPVIKDLLDRMNIKRLEIDDYEADDIIGTMSRIAYENGFDVRIYSSDKDLLQLINDKTYVLTPGKTLNEIIEYTEEKFYEVYGLKPIQMIDLKAIMGDKSDNIKGIAGIGEKSALDLLKEYETVEGIYEHIDEIKGAKKEKILNGKEDAFICKKMVTINRNSPINITINDTIKHDYDYDKLLALYRELEFNSLIKKLKKPLEQYSLFSNEEFDFKMVDESNYKLLFKDSYVYLENFNENYHDDSFIGIGVHNESGSFFIDKKDINKPFIKEFLEGNYQKYVYDYKKTIVTLNKFNLKINNVTFDLLLALYVINPNLAKDEIASILNIYGHTGFDYDSFVYLSGAKKRLPDKYTYSSHISKKAYGLSLVYNEIINSLKESNQYDLFLLELKLSEVLASMEIEGMKVDLDELNRQGNDLQVRIKELEDKIYSYTSEKFNINSVKQLGTFLFEELGLPVIKKNKTGYSTDNDVLEKLLDKHPIINYILEYRKLTKLYTTYIEGIKDYVRSDSCVHTIFKQALTQTGRLSSIEPNLQNISVRTDEGKKIRKMFVPKNDYLLSLDYSQIELRVLAHMADVKNLIISFNNNEDIHERTAKLILGKASVTKQERNSAKAINFGIIYGMSAWSLSGDIGVSAKEAQSFIDKYYEAYPEIKVFMNKQIEQAKEKGFVETINNRRRFIPDINSSNFQAREFAKRTAMNAPIQGSAADIIKMAMVDVYEALKTKKSKMISQVHDELIFDCTKDEIEDVLKIVKEKMENVMKLKVPLVVDGSYGKTWLETK